MHRPPIKSLTLFVTLVAAILPCLAHAQTGEEQIALAVLPLPENARETATVNGYRDGEMVLLREGTGDFVCLADNPAQDRFQVACYHKSLEPYMARGRELREQGITGQSSIHQRWEEIQNGQLEMPRHPASLYQLFGAHQDSVTTGSTEGLGRLTVIYMSYATAAETGLPTIATPGVPWLMYEGSPTAHVMISGAPTR